ncbi:hypothetical protein F385_4260 [Pantoea agglomerans 299R]|nr:hypothetical protein F385_4260 [Pantoea agglomerans 299R]
MLFTVNLALRRSQRNHPLYQCQFTRTIRIRRQINPLTTAISKQSVMQRCTTALFIIL